MKSLETPPICVSYMDMYGSAKWEKKIGGTMRKMSKILCALVVVVVLCSMMAVSAFAADNGNMWLNNAADTQQGITSVVICADTTVTNGMVEVRYDSSKLTYSSVSVSDEYVGVFAVNNDIEGVVKIAWVAPGAYETDGTGIALITVNFQGNAGDSKITFSGNVYDAEGDLVDIISDVHTLDLEKAIAKAEKLNKGDYTEESFAAVEKALKEAKAVLADEDATQAEIDAATKQLNDAMKALVKEQGDSADTGDKILPVMCLMMFSAAVVVAMAGKKGWWAK